VSEAKRADSSPRSPVNWPEAWIAEVAEFLEEHFIHWLEAIFSVDASGNLSRTLRELQQVFLVGLLSSRSAII
jgi:hypothetical protein